MFRSVNVSSFDWCVLESMEKLKPKHPVEKIGDTSHESGDNLLSPKTILISRENSTPEEGMQCPFS